MNLPLIRFAVVDGTAVAAVPFAAGDYQPAYALAHRACARTIELLREAPANLERLFSIPSVHAGRLAVQVRMSPLSSQRTARGPLDAAALELLREVFRELVEAGAPYRIEDAP